MTTHNNGNTDDHHYVGWFLEWDDPETDETKVSEIKSVGPMPYLWVEPGGGVPEQCWNEVRPYKHV